MKMHPPSKNLIFHIANEVSKQSTDTPKQAETNRTNRADPQMLVSFKTPKPGIEYCSLSYQM